MIVDRATSLHPIEIKSGATFRPEWLRNLDWFNRLQQHDEATLIYGGSESYRYRGCQIVSWSELENET